MSEVLIPAPVAGLLIFTTLYLASFWTWGTALRLCGSGMSLCGTIPKCGTTLARCGTRLVRCGSAGCAPVVLFLASISTITIGITC